MLGTHSNSFAFKNLSDNNDHTKKSYENLYSAWEVFIFFAILVPSLRTKNTARNYVKICIPRGSGSIFYCFATLFENNDHSSK